MVLDERCYTLRVKYFLVGLGNPGGEYEQTRHNAGRSALIALHTHLKLDPFEKAAHSKALVARGELGGTPVALFLPESFMNNSGKEVASELQYLKKHPEIVVVYDDMDLPLGTIKISFGRGSGGHRGLESIIKKLKTKDFARVRIGIAPQVRGAVKKPVGEAKVVAFLMKRFIPAESKIFTQVSKRVEEALTLMVQKGYTHAMNVCNSA